MPSMGSAPFARSSATSTSTRSMPARSSTSSCSRASFAGERRSAASLSKLEPGMDPAFVIGLAARDDPRDAEADAAIDRACFTDGTVNVADELERPRSRVWIARTDHGSVPQALLIAWPVADDLTVLLF